MIGLLLRFGLLEAAVVAVQLVQIQEEKKLLQEAVQEVQL
jgi:hypothetical protein